MRITMNAMHCGTTSTRGAGDHTEAIGHGVTDTMQLDTIIRGGAIGIR